MFNNVSVQDRLTTNDNLRLSRATFHSLAPTTPAVPHASAHIDAGTNKQTNKQTKRNNQGSVHGRNPAAVDTENLPFLVGSQLMQDIFHDSNFIVTATESHCHQSTSTPNMSSGCLAYQLALEVARPLPQLHVVTCIPTT